MNSKITSLRNFLGLFLVVSLFSMTANAQTVILSEDFSSITAGNNTETSGSGTVWTGNENFVVDPVNSKAFQAGGAVKLGTSSLIGFITSVPLDLSQGGGAFTVSFDVKGWSAAGEIIVTVTGQDPVTVPYTNAMTGTTAGPFETKTINFTGGIAGATIRFETTAAVKRAFLDNIIVTTTPATTIAAPVATDATVITNSGFTANWSEVTGATGYRLDVSTAADFSTFTGVYNDFAVTGASQEVTGLESNTVYYFRVRAIDAASTSVNSNIIETVTECGPFVIPDLVSGEFCPGSTVADLPLATSEGYQWFATETGGNALALTDVLATGSYYLMQTINACESERAAYAVNVIIVEAPVYAEPEIEVCNSGTIADITPENSGYLFYTTATGGTALAPATPLVSETTLYVSRVVGECESARTEVLVELEVPLVPTGDAIQDFTEGETLAALNVIADEELLWFADEALTEPLDLTTPLVDDVTYYAVNDDAGCWSAPLAVTANNPLGSSSFAMAGLVTFPNPVKDVFTVSYTSDINSVVVYNMLGQVVLNADFNAASVQVNMSGFTAGTYLVKVVSGSESKTIKVVKQ